MLICVHMAVCMCACMCAYGCARGVSPEAPPPYKGALERRLGRTHLHIDLLCVLLRKLQVVLRPFSNFSNLKLWDYYLTEDLAHGSFYDFELLDEMHADDESDIVDLPLTSVPRCIVNSCYDNVMQVVPDSCSYLLQVSSGIGRRFFYGSLGTITPCRLHW